MGFPNVRRGSEVSSMWQWPAWTLAATGGVEKWYRHLRSDWVAHSALVRHNPCWAALAPLPGSVPVCHNLPQTEHDFQMSNAKAMPYHFSIDALVFSATSKLDPSLISVSLFVSPSSHPFFSIGICIVLQMITVSSMRPSFQSCVPTSNNKWKAGPCRL